ncbi:MAG: MaoC family dehydratase [Nocardioidaceae bacterium]
MSWEAGQQLEKQEFVVRRADLVRYAGAAGDFNPIHWNDRIAHEVGLPGVVAHGMYTLALAGRALMSWVPDPAAVQTFGARFTRPVVVPDDEDGARVEVSGSVTSLDEETGFATLELAVTHNGQKVLGMCRAVVRC